MKPASPLPWFDAPEAVHWPDTIVARDIGRTCRVSKVFVAENAQDRAYIVHAANCFPALVEALGNIMRAADDMCYHRTPSKAGWDDLATFVESARAALAAAQKGLDR